MKFSGKVWSDHGTPWLHFWSIPRNRAMPRCATLERGLLCFRTAACSSTACIETSRKAFGPFVLPLLGGVVKPPPDETVYAWRWTKKATTVRHSDTVTERSVEGNRNYPRDSFANWTHTRQETNEERCKQYREITEPAAAKSTKHNGDAIR